jgi:diguanylate cyclase (GGDEF)-like protein/PAS domain S-box-containing protein
MSHEAGVFETAFTSAPMGVAVIGLDGRFIRVNEALCALLGRSEDELVGSTTGPMTHPDDLQVTADAYAHMQRTSTPLAVEKRYLRPDGTVVWAATKGTSVWGTDHQPLYIVAHFSDVTATKLAEQLEAEATARFEVAFSGAPNGMALVGLDGSWLKVNRMLCQLTGYTEEDLLARTFQEITHPDDLDADMGHVAQLLAGSIDRYSMEKRYVTRQGDTIWANLSVSLVRDGDGAPQHFISHIEDISERKRLEESLQRLADRDPLTDLWNRRRFEDELQRQISRCQRYREQAVLLMIDLDGFKEVNDTYGHRAGDDLLRSVASALSGRLRRVDSLARLGGDEFAVILVNVLPEQAAGLAAALRIAVASASITVEGREVSVKASVGIALLDDATTSDDEAMQIADLAMYAAKSGARRKNAAASGTTTLARSS